MDGVTVRNFVNYSVFVPARRVIDPPSERHRPWYETRAHLGPASTLEPSCRSASATVVILNF
jgi:hypothetical protein